MKGLVFERSLPRFAAARLTSAFGSGRGAATGPLRLADLDPPAPRDDAWHSVRPLLSGICGSDLATVDGHSSRYFEELVSFPFVPGHEVVGALEGTAQAADGSALLDGARVVIEPVLGCRARGIEPPCVWCAAGHPGNCERVTTGHLRPGIQTGYCADTGGGWSAAGLVAHESQLHAVPDGLADVDAVLVEPLACGLHAASAPERSAEDTVAVIGAGTVGLTVIAGLDFLARKGLAPAPKALLVGARYRHQRSLAEAMGATAALPSDRLTRAVRRESGSLVVGDPTTGGMRLSGGADVVFDCVGSEDSLAQALATVRPRGQVMLVGMPGRMRLDLAPLWHREIRLVGSYAYGSERFGEAAPLRTFDLALELAGDLAQRIGSGRLVSAAYPLDRFEEALVHAGSAGRRGAVKVVFDVRAGSPAGSRPKAQRPPDRRPRNRRDAR